MRAVRDRELNSAAAILGVSRVIPLGYSDGDLAYDAHPRVLRGQFMRLIREHRPDMMFTWDPFTPYEGHPDHRAVATAANEAAAFAHFPNFYPEHAAEGLEPHYVGEHWYFAKSPRDQNKFVDIDAHIDTKIAALCAHTEQMVLTVTDMQHHLAASGLDVPWLADLHPRNYHDVIARQMKSAGRAVAARAGLACTYAEGFRRTRFGNIEAMAKDQQIAEDV
jgi:LmbE family N-acetylglucosaminyl deacetylase